jgi:acetyl esterase/lipase
VAGAARAARSTRRDSHGRWLWRLVGLVRHRIVLLCRYTYLPFLYFLLSAHVPWAEFRDMTSPHILVLLFLGYISAIFAQSVPTSPAPLASQGKFHPRNYTDPQGGNHPFFIFVPGKLPTDSRPPVMLFLHGAGERGNNNLDQAMAGLGPAIWKRKANFPFIVVLPQCREGANWLAEGDDAKWALAMLRQIEAEFNTDRDRVVLTGLSLGGNGTWSIAATDPTAWSAIVPMCARPEAEAAAAFAAVQLPIWNFCGDKDRTDRVSANRAMTDALKQAGANAKYTEYPGVEHNCWDNAYGTDELYTWMLAQSRTKNQSAARTPRT